MTTRAEEDDFVEIADIYRRRHPDDPGQLAAAVGMEPQTLVARDDTGKITGFAMVIALNCGVSPYGIIHQIEVSPDCPGRDIPNVRHALIEACVSWLGERGADLVYARTVDKSTETVAMLRYTKSRSWTLDPTTGKVADADPAPDPSRRPASGAQPQPIQAARFVAN